MHGCIEELTISQSPGYVHGGRVGEGEQNPGYPQNMEFRETNTPGGPWSNYANILEHKKVGRVSPHPHWQKGSFL